MDELLEELGGNITYQDLFKIHRGHGRYGSSDNSDTSSESDVSGYDLDLKPRLYTYEEVLQNLVGAEDSLGTELEFKNEVISSNCSGLVSSNLDSDLPIKNAPDCESFQNLSPESQKPSTPLEIAKELSRLITIDYCFICSQSSNKHYKHEGHYKKVIKWLEMHKEIIGSIDIKLIFCQICNLPLSGNDEAKNHYAKEDHQINAKSFCEVCSRVIDAVDMRSHCKSKKHLANIHAIAVYRSELKESSKKPAESLKVKIESPHVTTQLHDVKENVKPSSSMPSRKTVPRGVNSKSYASVLKSSVCKRKTSLQAAETKKSELLATQATSTEKRKREIANQRQMPNLLNPFAVMLIEKLRRTYCGLCKEAVHKGKGYHYRKKHHYQVLRDWIDQNGISFGYDINNIESVMCFSCHLVLPTFNTAQDHYRSEQHEKMVRFYCDVCMTHDNSDVHKTHKSRLEMPPRDRKDIKIAKRDPKEYLKTSMKYMLTENRCNICSKDNLDNHYFTKQHTEMFRCWLTILVANTEAACPLELIFCEFCNLELLEMEEPTSHYQTKEHMYNELQYCSICIFRGSLDELVRHRNSNEHHDKLLASLPAATRLNYIEHRIKERRKNERKKIIQSKQNKRVPDNVNGTIDSSPVAKQKNLKTEQIEVEHVKVNRTSNKQSDVKLKNQPNSLNKNMPQNTEGHAVNTENKAGLFIAQKLKDVISENYCSICKADVHHISTKEHIKNLRKWLNNMIQNTGIKLNHQLLFCEDCQMGLSGTKESINHYQTKLHLENHLTYCSVCIWRGTPETMVMHQHSEEHRQNLCLLGLNKPVTENTPIEAKEIEDVESIEDVAAEKEDITGFVLNQPKLNAENPVLYPADTFNVTEKTTNSSDKKNITLLQLGLNLGQYSPKNEGTNSKEHELCNDIFAEYWKFATMMEIVPLEVCASKLRIFNKEVSGVFKQYLQKLNESTIDTIIKNAGNQNFQHVQENEIKDILKKMVINQDNTNQTDQNVQQNGIFENTDCLQSEIKLESTVISRENRDILSEINMESVVMGQDTANQFVQNIEQTGIFKTTGNLESELKLKSTVKSLDAHNQVSQNRTDNSTAFRGVRRLIMLVRNLKKTLERMKSGEDNLNMESVLQFNDEYYPSRVPYLEGNRHAIELEVYNYILKKEIQHLNTFIKKQERLNPDIVLHCLKQFNKTLLQEENMYDFNDYLYKPSSNEFSPDTDLDTKNISVAEVIGARHLENNIGVIEHDDKFDMSNGINSHLRYLPNGRKIDRDSDTSFDSATECSCEGSCRQKNHN